MSNLDEMWGSDGILSFPINCDSVLKHLKQDMRDDWFADTIAYNDLFSSKEHIKKIIANLLEEGNGQYPGNSRTIYDIPKKGLGIRYSLETDFFDRFIYQAICTFLIEFFDPLLSHRVFGHRLNKKRRDERYLFKNRIDLWRTFEGVTYTAIENNQALLATDLINYFENISVDLIRTAFLSKISKIDTNGREKLRIRNAIETLCSLLVRWGYSERHGLPQNRDASSFIANVVLSDVDHKMVELGYDYYRYVDDIRIICESPQHARKAITDLIGQLRTVGMNINSAKTEILSSDSSPQKIADFFPATDDRSLAIDNMWRSRSRRVIFRSIAPLCEMLREIIQNKETQSRQFRFAVNRLKILLDSRAFDIDQELTESLASIIIDALDSQAASSDQFCRLLSILDASDQIFERIEKYLGDPLKSIHPWQNYHLWLLMAKKKRKSSPLLEVALKKIDENILAPEVPAIFIYLKCVNNDHLIEPTINKFNKDWPYQHQRYFLLATKDFEREKLKPLISELTTRLKGTASRATKHLPADGTLVISPESADILAIYDNISPYE